MRVRTAPPVVPGERWYPCFPVFPGKSGYDTPGMSALLAVLFTSA